MTAGLPLARAGVIGVAVATVAFVAAATLVGCSSRDVSDAEAAPSCSGDPHPRFDLQEGVVTPASVEGEVVTGAYRDASTTIISVCRPDFSLQGGGFELRTVRRTLSSGGGSLQGSEQGAVQYSYYQASRAERLWVVSKGDRIAEISFAPTHWPRCATERGEKVSILLCGVLTRVTWQTDLRLSSRRVAEVSASARGSDGESLGFMLWRTFNSKDRLTLTFSCFSTDGPIHLRILEVSYWEDGEISRLLPRGETALVEPLSRP